MKLYILVLLSLSGLPAMSLANMRMNPRLTHPVKGKWSFSLPKVEANPVFYLSENRSLYIGGEAILYHFHFEMNDIYKNYTIEADSNRCVGKPHCNNHITFVGQLLGKFTVCGTNANNPGCWAMNGENFEKLRYDWAEQMAPRTLVTNYNILLTGNQIYSTLSRKTNNGKSAMTTLFRKIHGNEPLLYTGEKFLRQPEIVKSLVVEKEDKGQNKILLFFTEDNNEARAIEKRLPMVAQLCKEESGSENGNTRYIFSTALKSRMICGNQLTGQYYPHLQDIYFLQGKTGNLIYGLFKNSWSHSAVCSYNVEDIERLFNTSSLWGSSKKDLQIRPGTCLPHQMTPKETSEEASNYPELTEWLWPTRKRTVFQNLDNYRKIVVDETTAVNQNIYRVLILATDDGTIHKVAELDDGTFNILQVMPFKQKGNLQFMELEPNEHVLYMGTTHEIARIPLDDCAAYNTSCASCIRSSDPFCGWIDGKCESVLKYNSSSEVYQDLKQNASCKYEEESKIMPLRGDQDTSANEEQYKTQYFLTCPTMLKHANYMWKNGDMEMGKCNYSDDVCLLIIKEVTSSGEYRCIAKELETEHAVFKYKFSELNTSTKIQGIWLLVWTIQLLISM